MSYVDYVVSQHKRLETRERSINARRLALEQYLAMPWWDWTAWLVSTLIVFGVTFLSALLGFGMYVIVCMGGGIALAAFVFFDLLQIQHLPSPISVTPRAWLEGTRGEYAGRRFQLDQNGLTIGRGSSNTLALSERAVSRQHARIRYSAGAWFIQDSSSGGGTLVNGRHEQATRLGSGDQIQIGSSTFVFYLRHPES